MAAAALRARRIGAAAGRNDVGASAVIIVDLTRSVLSRSRNSGRGIPSRSRSISRCEYLVMGPSHAGAHFVQRAQLQLLDGAFALADPRGGLADAALVDEALDNHAPLVVRQAVD